MTSDEIYDALIHKYQTVMRIILGSLNYYLDSDLFDDLTDKQKERVLEHVVVTLGEMMPPQLESLWRTQLVMLALDQAIETKQKRETEKEAKKVARNIMSDLGW